MRPARCSFGSVATPKAFALSGFDWETLGIRYMPNPAMFASLMDSLSLCVSIPSYGERKGLC